MPANVVRLVVADSAGDDVVLCQVTSQLRTDAFTVALERQDFDQGQLTVASVSIDSLPSILP
jgi:hypothetical protein